MHSHSFGNSEECASYKYHGIIRGVNTLVLVLDISIVICSQAGWSSLWIIPIDSVWSIGYNVTSTGTHGGLAHWLQCNKFFPFSWRGRALDWSRKLQPRSINSTHVGLVHEDLTMLCHSFLGSHHCHYHSSKVWSNCTKVALGEMCLSVGAVWFHYALWWVCKLSLYLVISFGIVRSVHSLNLSGVCIVKVELIVHCNECVKPVHT